MTATSNQQTDEVVAQIATDEAGAKCLQLKAGRKVFATAPLTKKRPDAIEAEIAGLAAYLAQASRAIRRMLAEQRKAASAAAKSDAASKPASGRRKASARSAGEGAVEAA